MVKIPLYNQGQGPAAGLATGSLGPKASTAGEQAVLAESQAIAKAFDVAGQFAQEERNAQVQAQLDEFNTRTFNEGRDISLNDTSTTTAEVEQKRQKFIEQKEREVANLSLTMSERKAFQQNLRREANNIFSKAGAAAFQRGQIFRSDATNDALQALIEKASQDPDMRDIHKAEFEEKVREGKLRGLTLEFDEDDFEYRLERRILLSEQEDAKLGTRYYEEKLKAIVSGEGPYKGMPVERLEALAGKTRGIIREKKAEAKRAAAAARADFLAKFAIQSGAQQAATAENELEAAGGYAGVVAKYGKDIAAVLEAARVTPNPAFSMPEDYDAAISDARQYIESNPTMAAEYLPVVQELQKKKAAFQESMRTDPVGTFVGGYTQRYGSQPSRAYISQHLRNQGISASPYTAEEKNRFKDAYEKATGTQQKLDIISAVTFGSLEDPISPQDQAAIRKELPAMLGLSNVESLGLLQKNSDRKFDMLVAAQTPSELITAGLKGQGESRGSVRAEVLSQLEDFNDAFSAAGASVGLGRIQEAVVQLASWRLATGKDGKLEDAVKEASKAVTDLYAVEEVNGHNTLIPNISGMEPSVVSNELGRLIQGEFLYENMDTRFYGELGEDRKAEMAIQKLKRRGRFAPYKNSDGEIIGYRLLEENGAVVLNNDQEPVEVSFRDIVGIINDRRLTPESIEENQERIDAMIKERRSEISNLVGTDPVKNANRISKLAGEINDLEQRSLDIKAIQDAQGQSTAPLDTSEQAEPEQAEDDKGGAVENNTTKLAPKEEKEFQKWIRSTGWFEEFVEEYGEEPDLNYSGYDYRGAWKAGVEPQRDKYDNNRYHWPSRFKSADHPTMWKESFMRETGGINPDSIGIKSEKDAEDYLDLFRAANSTESDFYKDFRRLPNPRKLDSDLEDLSLDELRFEAKRLGIAGLIDYLEEYYKEDRSSKEALEYSYKELITKFRKHNDDLYRINLFGVKRR